MASDKAKYARKWRMDRRRNRRFEILMNEYLSVKYPNIHTEIGLFYGTLNNKYPRKNNLTKTNEFKVWKDDQERAITATTAQQGTCTATTTTTTVEQDTCTTATTHEQDTATTATTTTTTVEQDTCTATTTTVIAAGQATTTPPGLSLYDLDIDIEDPPMYDLDIDDMDKVISSVIAEMEQDDELLSIMNNFSYSD